MPVKNEYIEVTVSKKNKKLFNDLNYDCKVGDTITVHYSLLPKYSRIKIIVVCDYCNREKEITVLEYNKSISGDIKKYSCSDCKAKKQEEISLKKYGVKSPMQLEKIQEKSRKTCLERYGVTNPFQNKEIREKQKNTVLKRYGVENVFQNKNVKQKIKETLKNIYGVEHIMHIQEVKDSVLTKSLLTKFQNGTGICSKQQEHIWKLVGGELNYPIDKLLLDIAFVNKKIYIEYNGSGHDIHVKYHKITDKEFKTQEIKRYKFLKSLGWKQILIISPNDFLLEDSILVDEIQKAISFLENNCDMFHYIIDISKYNNFVKL